MPATARIEKKPEKKLLRWKKEPNWKHIGESSVANFWHFKLEHQHVDFLGFLWS